MADTRTSTFDEPAPIVLVARLATALTASVLTSAALQLDYGRRELLRRRRERIDNV